MTAIRMIRLATWALVAVLVVATGVVLWRAQGPAEQAVADKGAIGGPFSLTDQNGTRVTDKDFAGRPHAVFFGYTHCPDVCPTTLGELSVMLGEMGADADKLDVWFRDRGSRARHDGGAEGLSLGLRCEGARPHRQRAGGGDHDHRLSRLSPQGAGQGRG